MKRRLDDGSSYEYTYELSWGCYYWVAPCLLLSHVARSTHDINSCETWIVPRRGCKVDDVSKHPSLKPRLP